MKRIWLWAVPLGLAAAGCAGGDGDAGEAAGQDFVADNPAGNAGNGGEDGGENATGGDTGAGGEEPPTDGGGDGGREIAEADIIHVEGDRLYALSQYSGLAVIDVRDPSTLPVLGRFRANAMPFEMYVEGDQVFVMFSDFGSYSWDAEAGQYVWRTSSRLMALDASDPENIQVRGDFEIGGSIQDSRRVGDVLYLVTYENGDCWGCQADINTRITSLDVSDPTEVQVVDEMRFVEPQDPEGGFWGWGARHVASTAERLYVAGVDYGAEVPRSTVNVVDISDPGGVMTAGAAFEVAGAIENRWQMDEHEGVLRVVSQPGQWGSTHPPVVETFAVAAADDVVPLGQLEMVLPRPEDLRSVRFDGERGYVITFEQTDPLFTLDLSDPAAPLQVGELEIPGWVTHMEPRGDRVLGLGHDPSNPEGALNVSLFDVSDFARPTLLSRVHFGGDWGSFAEDQDRLHKAFTILDEQGLLLVPFSGWSYEDDDACRGSYRSGIQLVDWADDALALRGVAEAHGRARRALVHREALLAVTDRSVESFDIGDRDAPNRLDALALSSSASSLAVEGDIAVRLSHDWWTDESILEVTDRDALGEPEPLGKLPLTPYLSAGEPDWACYEGGYSIYASDLLLHRGFVYLLRPNWYAEQARGSLDVIDVRDPTAPTYVRTVELPFEPRTGSYYGHLGGVAETAAVLWGDRLLMHRSTWNEGSLDPSRAFIEVVDLSDPANPVHETTLSRGDAIAHGALQRFGDTVVSWSMIAASEDASKVRYYLERLELAADGAPVRLEPVNVPGAVVAYDEATERALTLTTELETIDAREDACWSHLLYAGGGWEDEPCQIAHRQLARVQLLDAGAALLDRLDLEGTTARIRAVAASDTRTFVHLTHRSEWGGWVEEGGDNGANGDHEAVVTDEIVVLSDWSSPALEAAGRVSTTSAGWLYALQAQGSRLLFTFEAGLGEIDASFASSPRLQVHDTLGWRCWNPLVVGNEAHCAMGEFGAMTIPLSPTE